jgi:hypothetical protein
VSGFSRTMIVRLSADTTGLFQPVYFNGLGTIGGFCKMSRVR